MLSIKQSNIKYHFLNLWYNLTWDWTQVSQDIGKHSNHYANVQYNSKYKKKLKSMKIFSYLFSIL